MKYVDLLDKLTLTEKAKLVVGYTTWTTFPIDRLGIPSLVVSDGPTGVRKEKDERNASNGMGSTEIATCFPTSATLANSFNEDTFYKVGNAISKECRHFGVHYLLAPAMNIKRNPLCGRNFEYISEDPVLTGKLASSFVKGLQDNHVGVTLKHYAANQNETYRYNGSSNVDDRALHEIYLRNFEIAVKESNASGVMTSYNKINGVFASDNKYLITDCLRNEFGFDGLVMTDWGGLHDIVEAIKAGLDLEKPGVNPSSINEVIKAVKDGILPVEDLDKSVKHILTALDRYYLPKEENPSVFIDNYSVALNSAIDSAVLLKNDGILPLKKDTKYLVIGDLFKHMRYQGAGSSQVFSYKLIDNVNAFEEANINYEFTRGYYMTSGVSEKSLMDEALSKAKEAEIILYFGGLTDTSESEGFDRDTYKLPINQIELLNELAKLNKKIVFIMYGGSPFEIPNYESFNAMLNMYLPGEAGGEALVKLLFGEVSPSGRLNESWPISYDDVIFGDEYHLSGEENYKESIYVGYRYYSSINKKVRFPFGYGLSYSSFDYKDMKVSLLEKSINVKFKLTNVGEYDASEVSMVFISKKDSLFYRPKYELKGFKKTLLTKGESKEVSIDIPLSYLEIYSPKDKRMFLEDGEYEIHLCKNAEEVIASKSISLKGEKIVPDYSEVIKEHYYDLTYLKDTSKEVFEELFGRKIDEYIYSKRPYTLETPIGELNTFFGKIIKNSMTKAITKSFKKGLKSDDPKEVELAKKNINFMRRMILSNSFRSLSYSSSGLLPKNIAMALVNISNNRPFKGLKYLLMKEKIIKE